MVESFDIVKLAELLNPKKENDSDSDEDNDDRQNQDSLPAGASKKSKENVYAKLPPAKLDEKFYFDPENEDASNFPDEYQEHVDWKKVPRWDVSYKQQVTASDVFLQMGAKNQSTASCEDMIIKIHLPEEDRHNIDLKVTENNIKLTSPKYRLDVPLPHPVDPQRGNAQWDRDAENLIVTLRMNREFDYVNF